MPTLRAMVIVILVSGVSAGRAQPQDAAAHQAWMDDAGDLQEDLREQLSARSRDKAAAAAAQLEAIMAKTQAYWSAKHADDIVGIAQESRTLARTIADAAKAGQLDEAIAASAKLNARCNACHDLHPEKR